jgi:hypothetical protein
LRFVGCVPTPIWSVITLSRSSRVCTAAIPTIEMLARLPPNAQCRSGNPPLEGFVDAASSPFFWAARATGRRFTRSWTRSRPSRSSTDSDTNGVGQGRAGCWLPPVSVGGGSVRIRARLVRADRAGTLAPVAKRKSRGTGRDYTDSGGSGGPPGKKQKRKVRRNNRGNKA